MGHWVTLDDDQHVYISDGGKVLAKRSAISSAGGGKDRGKSLIAKSKAAIGKITGKQTKTTGPSTGDVRPEVTTRAIEHAKAAGPTLREQADKARAAKGTELDRVRSTFTKMQKSSDDLRKKAAIEYGRSGSSKDFDKKKTRFEMLRQRAKVRMQRANRVLDRAGSLMS
jgi:hypothetical protein